MTLRKNDLHLYFSYPEQLSDPVLLHRYESLLSDDELAQMARFYYARHRHQYLVTRALVRTCLSAYHPVNPADWRFRTNAYGKPEVRHPDGGLPVKFNLSHTRGLVICGIVRDYDIGVDVEDTQRTTRAAMDSLSSYFSVPEIEDVGRLSPEKQKQRFFDYWTLKESYIKARGMGLAIPLSKFSFQFEAEKLAGFHVHPDLDDDAAKWRFWRIPMAQRYQIAVAVNSAQTDFELAAFNSVPLVGYDTFPLTLL